MAPARLTYASPCQFYPSAHLTPKNILIPLPNKKKYSKNSLVWVYVSWYIFFKDTFDFDTYIRVLSFLLKNRKLKKHSNCFSSPDTHSIGTGSILIHQLMKFLRTPLPPPPPKKNYSFGKKAQLVFSPPDSLPIDMSFISVRHLMTV